MSCATTFGIPPTATTGRVGLWTLNASLKQILMIKATCNTLLFSASFSHHWKLQRCGDIVRQRSNCLSNAQGKPDHHTWLTVECFCLFLNVKWWNNVRCSGCGRHLRGTCCICLLWGRSWPTMRMTQTPGWSAISLWITTMHRWASDFGFQTPCEGFI